MNTAADREASAFVARLEPTIKGLAEDALQRRDTHALLVLDPDCAIFRGAGSGALKLLQDEMGRGASVAVFHLEPLYELFSILEKALGAPMAGAVARLREEPPPGRVRMAVLVGSYLGIHHRDCGAASHG